MSSLRNQLRPKHQVLILKCYPKFQKNVADVKPNSSELSYLLFYASSRRSKIQKVGAFLEKKTEADVRKVKIGNVQVTLQILTALIDRTRRDLTLYAPYVLRILQTVLASGNLGLAEDSLATFLAFCDHQDVATFAADQSLVVLYENVVKSYASFARKSTGQKAALSTPASVRWRTVGLGAIKGITKSDAVGIDGGQQLNAIIAPILANLRTDSEDSLRTFHAKLDGIGQQEKDPLKGRPSIATQRTTDTSHTGDGTTADADRIAEEEVGTLALSCLRQLFAANNRAQIRLATQIMLKYIITTVHVHIEERPGTAKTVATAASIPSNSWASTIIKYITEWTPVQDRFVIMVTTMEELVRSPIAEENMEQQYLLVTLVDALLSSSINMIGLSVMDVLLGLVQHILLVLQLGGKGSNILPHHQQTDAIDIFGSQDGGAQPTTSPLVPVASEEAKDSTHASGTRQRLLTGLRLCIGSLANHIYYSDQISDMISAILLRLKPSPLSSVANPVVAVENPEAAAQAISDSVNMQEDPRTDAFFSFGTARVTALKAIKEVLVVANSKASVTGAGAVGRNRVPVQTWEGTQWLLRDEDKRVRRAYVDALTTWLRLEMSKNDLSVMEDRETRKPKSEKPAQQPTRAVSSASRRSKSSRAPNSTFLQLLHLAIYDNAIETPEDESETLLLHLLMCHLVEKLGVNSVQHGLPMMVRLQEDINQLDTISTPKAKIVVGSLVHGYFWALCRQFNFEHTDIGQEIVREIQRRKHIHLWFHAIEMPAVALNKIMVAGAANAIKRVDPEITQNEVLKPFDSIHQLVNQIAVTYNRAVVSPPSSPPASPSRNRSTPILATAATHRARELSDQIRDNMLNKWTKSACLASIESELTRTGSIHGSQRGTLRSLRNGLLHVETVTPRDSSPGSDHPPSPRQRSMRRGLNTGKAPTLRSSVPPEHRQSRSPGGSEARVSDNSLNPANIVRFEDLKRVLDGNLGTRASTDQRSSESHSRDFTTFSQPSDRANRVSMSAGSESMVDAEGLVDSDEETDDLKPQRTVSRNSSRAAPQRGSAHDDPRNRTRSSSTASAEDPEANARALKGEIVAPVVKSDEHEDPDAVPPVPPLPEGLIGKVNVPRPATNDFGLGDIRLDSQIPADRRSNAQRILSTINIGGDEVSADGETGRPPY